jgi:hypothetical protein
VPTYRQVRSALKLALCLLLCVGATLDDIDYISALRARVSAANRTNPSVEDDSDDQHAHLLASTEPMAPCVSAAFLAVLWVVQPQAACPARAVPPAFRSARAPPVVAA